MLQFCVALAQVAPSTASFYEKWGFKCSVAHDGALVCTGKDGTEIRFASDAKHLAPVGDHLSIIISDASLSASLELVDPNGIRVSVRPARSAAIATAMPGSSDRPPDCGSLPSQSDSLLSFSHDEQPDLRFVEHPPDTNKIGLLTSGGDSQGMNAAIRAIVRTAIAHKCRPVAVYGGFAGLIRGGTAGFKQMSWDDVAFLLSEGGTVLQSSRCSEFMEKEGRRRAVKNLVDQGIDKLIVIGGDGSLTGADTLRSEWRDHLDQLVRAQAIPSDSIRKHPHLMVVGLVGSIDNDMCGTEITIGANSSLHRITEAVDNIRTTAVSHTRAFIIEVMGRHCGWLALNAALAVGADWLLIPESPPRAGWEASMCCMLQRNRELGKRCTIVIIAEGAVDRQNRPIRAQHIQKVLSEQLHLDCRITTLGHVQRGGSPSAYDRYLGTVQGVRAVRCLLAADPSSTPSLLVVKRENKIGVEDLKECVTRTRSIAEAMRACKFEQVFSMRDPDFINGYRLLQSLKVHDPQSPGTLNRQDRHKTIAVMHSGAPCAGMNAAVWAVVHYCLFQGHRVVGIGNGFAGVAEEDVRELRWADVEGWVWRGGADLGTNRSQPDDPASMAHLVQKVGIDGLIVIGGFEAFTALLALQHSGLVQIPMLCVPATISNNVPGTDYTVGSDTALNVIVTACDAIKQSASSSRKRVFVVECQGGNCGYLATIAGLGCGATSSYIPEEGLGLEDLQRDIAHLKRRFQDDKKQGRIVLRNEAVSSTYSTELVSKILEEESGGDFDSRWTILGHLQQGTLPSPMDRIRAIRLAVLCVKRIEEGAIAAGGCEVIGISGPLITFTPITDLVGKADMERRTCKDPWWLQLRPTVQMLAKYGPLSGDIK